METLTDSRQATGRQGVDIDVPVPTFRRPPPVVGIAGYAGAGKDTAARILCDHAGYVRVAFADEIKRIGLPILAAANPGLADIVKTDGWDVAKQLPQVRAFLQQLGAQMRHINRDIWVDAAMGQARKADGPVVISDVRFINEVYAVERAGGQVWRIDRPGIKAANGHASEALPGRPASFFDRIIRNDDDLNWLAYQMFDYLEDAP